MKGLIKIVELNIKQEKFCQEYAKTGNATKSYILAGYQVKNDSSAAAAAQQLLRNIKVQARLQELSQEVKQNQIADVIECQQILTEIARNKKTYPKDRIAAITTLMKAHGAFSQKLEINGSIPIILTDDIKE